LVDHGARIEAVGFLGLAAAATVCPSCLDLIVDTLDAKTCSQALVIAAQDADVSSIKRLVDRGADVHAVDPAGGTPLIFAAASDPLPLDVVKLLVDRGAKLDARTEAGLTALDYAKLHGDTPIVALLTKADAPAGTVAAPPPVTFVKGNTIQ